MALGHYRGQRQLLLGLGRLFVVLIIVALIIANTEPGSFIFIAFDSTCTQQRAVPVFQSHFLFAIESVLLSSDLVPPAAFRRRRVFSTSQPCLDRARVPTNVDVLARGGQRSQAAEVFFAYVRRPKNVPRGRLVAAR
jgi:hypothetical protein